MPEKPDGERERILAILKAHADEGISQVELEKKLALNHAQSDRRRRDLNSRHLIQGKYVQVVSEGGKTKSEYRYFYKGVRDLALDDAPISGRLKAEALGKARGRCGMCGKTTTEDGIKLVVDHKIPREWGGKTESDNLWAICRDCNAGKKNHFATFDPEVMKRFMQEKSVHVRIGELLKTFEGESVPGDLLEFVANRDDWQKRTRDLRYLGWIIHVTKKKIGDRVKSFYQVQHWNPWPADPTAFVRKFEKDRKKKNKAARTKAPS